MRNKVTASRSLNLVGLFQALGTYRLPLALLGLALLYAFTIPSNHTETEDSFQYAYDLRAKSLPYLLHPHHLIYLPVAKLFYRTGFFADAFAMLVNADVVFGVATIGMMWLVLRRRLFVDRMASLFGCFFVAVSYGFWRYSVAAEVYLPALFAQTLLCYMGFRSSRYWLAALLTGVTASFVLLVHAPLGMPLAIIALPLYFAMQKRWQTLLLYAAVAAAILLPVYYTAYRLQLPTHSFAASFLQYLRGPAEGIASPSWANFPKALIGFGATVVSTNYLFAIGPVAERIQHLMPYRNLTEELFMGRAYSPAVATAGLVLTAALLATFGWVTAKLRPSRARWQELVADKRKLTVFIWTVTYAVFVGVTDPDSPELWICFLLPLGLTCAILLEASSPAGLSWQAFLFLALLFSQNLVFGMAVIHSSESDYNLAKARTILQKAGAADTIFTRDNEVFTRYVRYYSRAEVVNCSSANLAATLDMFQESAAKGGKIYLFKDVVAPEEYFKYQHPELTSDFLRLEERLKKELVATDDPKVLLLAR